MVLDERAILQDIQVHLGTKGRLWVAFSGGLDSSVLLYLISRSPLAARTTAIHINHQLSLFADDWENHCMVVANDWGIPCMCEKADVNRLGGGLEQAAREARYEIFERYLKAEDVIVFAHHKNDQAETFMYRLMRGAGVKGLSAMQASRPLGKGKLVRPLLEQPRIALLQFAQANRLHWVEDPSNQDVDFDRNFLRNELFPQLEKRWPDAKIKISRSVAWLSEASTLMDQYADQDLSQCHREAARFGERILMEPLLSFTPIRRKHVIRRWCESLGVLSPEAAQIEKLDEVLYAKEDAQPCLFWGGHELRRYKQYLYLVKALPSVNLDEQPDIVVSNDAKCFLPDGTTLSLDAPKQTKLSLQVKFRQPDIRCRPKERAHSQTLKKLFQEYHVEPWLRSHMPLIFSGETLVAVGDAFVCDGSDIEIENIRWC